jgi:hypothetical protein
LDASTIRPTSGRPVDAVSTTATADPRHASAPPVTRAADSNLRGFAFRICRSAVRLRDRDGREVDLIIERRDGYVAAIEIKAAATASPADFRGLRYLRDRLGGRFLGGALLYTGAATVPFGDRLAAVPLSALWGGGTPYVT